MNIRHASLSDLPDIMKIYATARTFMAEHGNPRQWGATNWPPRELICEDIRTKRSYVCEDDGKIVGVFFYDYGEHAEPLYDHIENGAWIGGETYGVVHRIASDHSAKGVGSFCIQWAYEQCGHLRMDTHGDNTVMQNFLKKNGFTYCGITHVTEDNDPRLTYEKI